MLTNDLWRMNQAITIRKKTDFVDQSGGRPYEGGYEDYISNIPAELQEPSVEDVVIGIETAEGITHRIKIRYDPRVQVGMQVIWNDAGTWRNAKIMRAVDERLQHLYWTLMCIEYAWSDA